MKRFALFGLVLTIASCDFFVGARCANALTIQTSIELTVDGNAVTGLPGPGAFTANSTSASDPLNIQGYVLLTAGVYSWSTSLIPPTSLTIPSNAIFYVTSSLASNNPGDSVTFQTSSTASVQNVASGANSLAGTLFHDITLVYGVSFYTAPTIPPSTSILYQSNVSDIILMGHTGNTPGLFHNYINTSNTEGSTGLSGLDASGGADQTLPTTPAGANADAKSTTLTSALAAPYAINQIVSLHLGSGTTNINGSHLTFQDTVLLTGDQPPSVENPTPEPASVIVFGFGFACLFGYRQRRKLPV